MKLNEKQLSADIDAVAKDWDISGSILVMDHDQCLHQKTYGFANRSKGVANTPDLTILLHSEAEPLVAFCILLLLDQGKLSLKDPLSKYIPEYQHADKMTLDHLLKSNSGIVDYFYGHKMVELEASETHQGLSDGEKLVAEQMAYIGEMGFEKVLHRIGDLPLEYEPGTPESPRSLTNTAFLAEVVRRASGLSLFDFQHQYLFGPLGMTGVQEGKLPNTVSSMVYNEVHLQPVPLKQGVPGAFTATLKDFEKLLQAMVKRQIFTEKTWKKALAYNTDGDGIGFSNANGLDCCSLEFLGYGFYFYFNHESSMGFGSMNNERQTFRFENGQWLYFRRALREVVETAYTYPKATKIIKLNKENFWHAVNIQVEESQAAFVLEAKTSIAMSLLYKTKRGYVQMEGGRAVGLLVLDINPKKDYYNIDIIQIDKRYQGRGYGKHMLDWAVTELKAAGARELEIGVNRYNLPAQKLYKNAGFKAKKVTDGGMQMHMTIEDSL